MKSRYLATNKSELIDKLSKNYPNFFKKDLRKFVEIFLNEMKNSLKRRERIELRDVFSTTKTAYRLSQIMTHEQHHPNQT